MVFVADFVGLLITQSGDRYVFGHEVSMHDPDPGTFNCSELVEWGCGRLGVTARMPDGTWNQIRHCRRNDTEIPIGQGITTQGALLFRFSSDPFTGDRPKEAHVAVSLGNGSTIEARGTVGRRVLGRAQPRVDPCRPRPRCPLHPTTHSPQPGHTGHDHPAWLGRFLTQPPIMSGTDVRQWQQGMVARGWSIHVDGKYGPDSDDACRKFQAEQALRIDETVGPHTWAATFT